jgi:hypothetical protein
MTEAATYLDVSYPYDTKTQQGMAARLFGHDGARIIGATLNADGSFAEQFLWYPDGYIWPPMAMLDGAAVAARQTTINDLIAPPAARAALIAAQQAIVDAVTARIEASADLPAELLASDRAVLTAAQAQIATLSV